MKIKISRAHHFFNLQRTGFKNFFMWPKWKKWYKRPLQKSNRRPGSCFRHLWKSLHNLNGISSLRNAISCKNHQDKHSPLHCSILYSSAVTATLSHHGTPTLHFTLLLYIICFNTNTTLFHNSHKYTLFFTLLSGHFICQYASINPNSTTQQTLWPILICTICNEIINVRAYLYIIHLFFRLNHSICTET